MGKATQFGFGLGVLELRLPARRKLSPVRERVPSPLCCVMELRQELTWTVHRAGKCASTVNHLDLIHFQICKKDSTEF